MVHSLLKRILSLEKTIKILHSSTSIEDGESQMVKVTSVKFTRADDDPPIKNNFSKNGTTTVLPSSFTTRSNCGDRKWITCVILTVILLVLLATILLTFFTPSTSSHQSYLNSSSDQHYGVQLNNETSANLSSDSSRITMDSVTIHKKDDEVTKSRHNNYGRPNSKGTKSKQFDLKTVSRLSWEILNRKSSTDTPNNVKSSSNDRRIISETKGLQGLETDSPPSQPHERLDEGEIILPSVMVFTSRGSSSREINNLRNVRQQGDSKSKANCCRTQKYTQTVRVDGCEPLTVVNRMCFGQCVSVWVPSLFASFPVCKPSRSTWKAVTLTCGPQRDKKKRVKIQKVKRCSCMELK